MGRFFSDAVEKALRDIYYQERLGRGKEGFQLLEQASAAGDGDASCILARCLCGPQYVWTGHGFPEDDDAAARLLHKAVEQGSALAVLVCLRTGNMTPSMEQKMPFSSLKEAFDIVMGKARQGEPFCQYMIGNVYFWWDFLRIEEVGEASFPDINGLRAYIVENVQKCEEWFLRAYKGGFYLAGNNLYNYYRKGDEDAMIPPQPEKMKGLYRIGAEGGHPLHQEFWAKELKEQGRKEEALRWYKEAAEGGNTGCWYDVGMAYELGEGTTQDYAYAAECYVRGLNDRYGGIGCHNSLGALYFEGKGVPRDYAKAYQLLMAAYEMESKWGLDFLGKSCFYGLGTPQDYIRAREFLEQVDWDDPEVYYLLGFIYARGMGVPADIAKGVGYLEKAKDFPQAREERLRYKKTLFGKWVVR